MLFATMLLCPAWARAADLDGATLSPLWGVPFAGILLSIALFPLVAPKFWHHHYGKIAAAWGVLFLAPFAARFGVHTAVANTVHALLAEYVPFIVLLTALYVVAGGICVRGNLHGTPALNTGILALGTALASFMGTTGAAMLLIRPLLRANANRRHRAHTVVFFIFLVANIGGSLTPLGDPPLFLGFLHGVPFSWTFSLGGELLLVASLVLGIYLLLDAWLWMRESPEVRTASPGGERLRIDGGINLLFLAGVLLAVIASGVWHPGEVTILGIHQGLQNLLRDAVLLGLLAASWVTTPRPVREANGYSWGPIQEVAILFAAIFATIIPPLAILKAGEHGALAGLIRAVQSPAQFFWATGILSSFLDNAPTYLTFLSTALGRLHPGLPEREAILALIAQNNDYLKAIATGAVFMGANTYIGNAPNFMIKAIAEESGVEMPSFFGYMKYSLLVLVPVFLAVTWVFF